MAEGTMKANVMPPNKVSRKCTGIMQRIYWRHAPRFHLCLPKSIGTMCGKAVSPRSAHGPNGVQARSFLGFKLVPLGGVVASRPPASPLLAQGSSFEGAVYGLPNRCTGEY